MRPKDYEDHPIPSGNSSAALALLRLAALTGERRYEHHALEIVRALHEAAGRHPQAFGHLLQAIHFHLAPPREVALVGDVLEPLAEVMRRAYRPTVVSAGTSPADDHARAAIPLLQGREAVDGRSAAYVCVNFACNLPVTEPEDLTRQLEPSARGAA